MTTIEFNPSGDGEFNNWQTKTLSIIQLNAPFWGILLAEVSALIPIQAYWMMAFLKANNKNTCDNNDLLVKEEARATYEMALDKFFDQWLIRNVKVPNSERLRMNLPLKEKLKEDILAPATAPVGIIDFSSKLQHTIHFTDEQHPRTKNMPEDVLGCEIWFKKNGDPPVHLSELSYLATNSSTPYILVFKTEDIGKRMYYRMRWINSLDQRGPWSEIISAQIMG